MAQKPEKPAHGAGAEKRRQRWLNLFVLVACYVVLTLGMLLATSPERYNLAVGDIAPQTITATKDVVDEVTTEMRRERAVDAVLPSYKEDETAFERVVERFDAIMAEFEAVRAFGEGLRLGTVPTASGAEYTFTGTFAPEDLSHAKSLCMMMSLTDWQITILMKQSSGDLVSVRKNTVNSIKKQMESTIREGQLEAAIASIQRDLQENISSDLCFNVAIPAVRVCLVPNMIIDQEATELNRAAARHEVDPSIYKSGQNIVVAGERVTSAQLAVLESLGLLEGNRLDVMMMAGVIMLGLLAILALTFHAVQFEAAAMARLKNVLMLAVIFAVTMLLSVLAAGIHPHLAPVSMVALLVGCLISPSLALTANMLALILVGVLINSSSTTFTQQMLSMIVAGSLSAPLGVYMLRGKQQRAMILLAGLSMALFNLFAMIAIGLLTNNALQTILSNAVWSAGGYVLAAVLCMGMQPLLEWLFNLVTPYKLLELANPNQPLLRRLLVETPGTYHHSILVANLAEAAAEAIGADPLLTRIGAYYHDIGKLKRPQYFKENQMAGNPHDRTDPRVSAAIIAEHVTDGILIARQNRLPEVVIDFIAEHHGDTLIAYFLHKMRSMEGGEKAQTEDFRYAGPKPRTAETAILMLADTVEAAVRAGGDQAPEDIEEHIRQLVKEKIDSGQLNDSPLRFADVQKIIHAFTLVLTGIYHKRIEYPKLGQAAALPPVRQEKMKIAEPVTPARMEPEGESDASGDHD
ncbi:MAG: HDIG domain-containing protein [Firmicutes bacterium]|nr:HDIG domain-containing protein [Bacillota bacterium]